MPSQLEAISLSIPDGVETVSVDLVVTRERLEDALADAGYPVAAT